MTSAHVVETSVNVFSNSPSQDYTHDTYDMTPGFKPFQNTEFYSHGLVDVDSPVLAKAGSRA